MPFYAIPTIYEMLYPISTYAQSLKGFDSIITTSNDQSRFTSVHLTNRGDLIINHHSFYFSSELLQSDSNNINKRLHRIQHSPQDLRLNRSLQRLYVREYQQLNYHSLSKEHCVVNFLSVWKYATKPSRNEEKSEVEILENEALFELVRGILKEKAVQTLALLVQAVSRQLALNENAVEQFLLNRSIPIEELGQSEDPDSTVVRVRPKPLDQDTVFLLGKRFSIEFDAQSVVDCFGLNINIDSQSQFSFMESFPDLDNNPAPDSQPDSTLYPALRIIEQPAQSIFEVKPRKKRRTKQEMQEARAKEAAEKAKAELEGRTRGRRKGESKDQKLQFVKDFKSRVGKLLGQWDALSQRHVFRSDAFDLTPVNFSQTPLSQAFPATPLSQMPFSQPLSQPFSQPFSQPLSRPLLQAFPATPLSQMPFSQPSSTPLSQSFRQSLPISVELSQPSFVPHTPANSQSTPRLLATNTQQRVIKKARIKL